MKYVEFGSNSKKSSCVMLGTMRISQMSVDEVDTLIKSALEVGINSIDTADIYGGGRCEELIGEVLQRNPNLRDEIFLQTKCGIHRDGDFTYFDFSRDYILKAVDESLARLKTDYLDSLLLHRPDALMNPDEIAEAFVELHDSGKVREFGVSNMNPMQIERLENVLQFRVVANQLRLSCAFTPAIDAGFNVNMENSASIMHDGSIFEYCVMNDIIIQAWSVLQHGYFDGVFIGSEKFPELNSKLDEIAKNHGVSKTAIALAWILRYPARMQVIIGTTKPDRVRDSATSADVELSRREWYEIYISAGNKLP